MSSSASCSLNFFLSAALILLKYAFREVEGNLSPIACQSEDGSGCGASCDCDARLFWQGLEDQINSYVDNHTLAQFMRVNEKTPAVLNGTERR